MIKVLLLVATFVAIVEITDQSSAHQVQHNYNGAVDHGYWTIDYPIRAQDRRTKEPTLNLPNFRLFLFALKVMKKARKVVLPPWFTIPEPDYPEYYN